MFLAHIHPYWLGDVGVKWHQFQYCFKYIRNAMSYIHEVRDREVDGGGGKGVGARCEER